MTSLKTGLQEESEWWRQRTYLMILIPNLIVLFWQRWTGIATQPNFARVNWSPPFGKRCRYVNSLIHMTPPGVYLTPFLVSTPSNCKIFRTNWTRFVPQIATSSPPSSRTPINGRWDFRLKRAGCKFGQDWKQPPPCLDESHSQHTCINQLHNSDICQRWCLVPSVRSWLWKVISCTYILQFIYGFGFVLYATPLPY